MHQPPTLVNLLCAQDQDAYYRVGHAQFGHANSKFSVNSGRLLVHRSSVDGAKLIVVSPSLRQCILLLSHHLPIVLHLSQRQMYDTLWCAFYWPHTDSEFERTVIECQSCVRNTSTFRHKRKVQSFPVPELLDFIAVDILGLFPKTRQGQKNILIITDFCHMLTRAKPTSKTTSTHIMNPFFDQ